MEKVSIAAIAFNGRKVLIAHRNPTGQMGGRWEFPGGKVEQGESDEKALLREFREEFSADILVKNLIAQSNFKHNGETVSLHAYEIELLTPEADFILTEHTEFRWAQLSEIPELDFVDSDMLIYPQILKYFAEKL